MVTISLFSFLNRVCFWAESLLKSVKVVDERATFVETFFFSSNKSNSMVVV